MQADTFLYLALGFREVQVDLHTVLYCELMAELQLLTAHRIDSVRAEGEGDAVAELAEALLVFVAALAVQCCTLGVALVEERVGEMCTEPHLFDSLGGLQRVHVHIKEAGRARAKHLEAGELGADIDVMRSHLRLDGPDIVLEPRHQR